MEIIIRNVPSGTNKTMETSFYLSLEAQKYLVHFYSFRSKNINPKITRAEKDRHLREKVIEDKSKILKILNLYKAELPCKEKLPKKTDLVLDDYEKAFLEMLFEERQLEEAIAAQEEKYRNDYMENEIASEKKRATEHAAYIKKLEEEVATLFVGKKAVFLSKGRNMYGENSFGRILIGNGRFIKFSVPNCYYGEAGEITIHPLNTDGVKYKYPYKKYLELKVLSATAGKRRHLDNLVFDRIKFRPKLQGLLKYIDPEISRDDFNKLKTLLTEFQGKKMPFAKRLLVIILFKKLEKSSEKEKYPVAQGNIIFEQLHEIVVERFEEKENRVCWYC